MKRLGLLLLLAAATSASALTTTLRAKYWYYGDTPPFQSPLEGKPVVRASAGAFVCQSNELRGTPRSLRALREV